MTEIHLKQIANGSEFPYLANQFCLGSFIMLNEIFKFFDFCVSMRIMGWAWRAWFDGLKRDSWLSNSKGALDMPICFYQNFLVSFNILLENKNESKTITVTWYLCQILFSHRHHTRLIISCKVSGFSWFNIIFFYSIQIFCFKSFLFFT